MRDGVGGGSARASEELGIKVCFVPPSPALFFLRVRMCVLGSTHLLPPELIHFCVCRNGVKIATMQWMVLAVYFPVALLYVT